MKSSEAVAELDFKITEVDFSGVARGDPPQTPIKSIEAELDFNSPEMDCFGAGSKSGILPLKMLL